ncbi:hypothetical protein HMPREF3145_11200 [Corynebacterium sp. HMSC05C01]|uniref:DIP1984 family protein n=1 Tax=Corynebacterium sp. HMSC05C01 TaxID=1581113 RepID=UPI0008A5433C|nr:DIP1984 family protein [Corynebacterium sp. HMSC05C01]OFT67521.1 hypothetical protein HMPREF3145_11200 [Corynebacterium sp. HMSC05C01]
MLLAEALARRAEAQDRLNKLQERLMQGALMQEGDTPVEDPAELLKEAAELLQEIETLVRRINHTNAQTAFEGATLTDAIARRDALLRSRRLYAAVADAGTMTNARYSRSEVRFVPTIDVKSLRDMADNASKAYRELDTKIQQLNWTTQLIEG